MCYNIKTNLIKSIKAINMNKIYNINRIKKKYLKRIINL